MPIRSNEDTELDTFLTKLFAQGCKESFTKLSKKGCLEKELSTLLFDVSSRTVEHQDKLLFDTGGLSAKQLTHLSRDLISVARLVGRVNKTPLNPKFGLLWAPPDTARDQKRKRTARLYDMLPGLMQTYSVHLAHFSQFSKANLKRLTFAHYYALKFLRYVHESTGSPHYDHIANLLVGGFVAAGGAEGAIPKFFTTDALSKLNQRSGKLRY